MNKNVEEKLVGGFMPKLKNWEFRFPVEDTKEDVLKIVSSFVDEFESHHANNNKHYEAPASFVLSGKVYGRKGFEDGAVINTSFIASIDKVDWKPDQKEWFSGKYSLEELGYFSDRDIYCATTTSGSKYYLDSSEMSPQMILMLGAYIH